MLPGRQATPNKLPVWALCALPWLQTRVESTLVFPDCPCSSRLEETRHSCVQEAEVQYFPLPLITFPCHSLPYHPVCQPVQRVELFACQLRSVRSRWGRGWGGSGMNVRHRQHARRRTMSSSELTPGPKPQIWKYIGIQTWLIEMDTRCSWGG